MHLFQDVCGNVFEDSKEALMNTVNIKDTDGSNDILRINSEDVYVILNKI